MVADSPRTAPSETRHPEQRRPVPHVTRTVSRRCSVPCEIQASSQCRSVPQGTWVPCVTWTFARCRTVPVVARIASRRSVPCEAQAVSRRRCRTVLRKDPGSQQSCPAAPQRSRFALCRSRSLRVWVKRRGRLKRRGRRKRHHGGEDPKAGQRDARKRGVRDDDWSRSRFPLPQACEPVAVPTLQFDRLTHRAARNLPERPLPPSGAGPRRVGPPGPLHPLSAKADCFGSNDIPHEMSYCWIYIANRAVRLLCR